MNQVGSIVEDVTPDSPGYMGASAFVHLERHAEADDAADIASPSRKFLVTPSGGREVVGVMGSLASPVEVRHDLLLEVLYRAGPSAWEILRVIAEDVDRLGWSLMQPSKWGSSSIYNVGVDSYSIELGEGSGDVAVCAIPITVHYRPAFTG